MRHPDSLVLGHRYRDEVTGFEGTLTQLIQHLGGRTTAALEGMNTLGQVSIVQCDADRLVEGPTRRGFKGDDEET